jgi:hypothetical protein
MKTALAILLVQCSLLAAAQEKSLLPQPLPGNVTLTLDEFNRLNELANKPPKKADTPPLPYSLKNAELKLTAAANSISGTMQVRGEVLKKGVVAVPLTRGITIFNARQEGKDLPLQLDGGVENAVLTGPSEFSLLMDIGEPLSLEAGRASVTVPTPAAGSVTLSLVVPGEFTAVKLSRGLVTGRTSEHGHTTVLATLVPGQNVNIQWTTRDSASATPAAAKEVRFLADVKTLLSVTEAQLNAAVLADVNVVQGEPSQFDVEIPTGYEVTGVTGAALDSTEQKSSVLTLKVGTANQKAYEFLISMERSLSETKADAPIIQFKGAQRETGEVLVEGTGSTEITAKEGGSMKRMDVKETNPNLRSLARFPAQAAFRYHRQPNEAPMLALEWVRFPDSTVLAAVAENAEVTTLVTTEGKSLTEVKLTIKNQAQPFLKVALPAGASFLSADVAGEKVKPVEAPDGNRVPLLKTGFRPTDAYTVSFVFMHSGAPFAKKGGSDLSLPGMDIPINLLQWEVFLPEQYKVKDFSGDVMPADRVPQAFVESAGLETYVAMQPGIIGGIIGGVPAAAPTNYRLEPLLQGQLGGLVLDPSGAVIPNAHVSVTSTETGYRMDATTNGEGFWRVWNVPTGRVDVKIESQGFQMYQAKGYFYDAQRPQALNTRLQVGAAMETVEVTAGAASVDIGRMERENKKQQQAAQMAPSANVINLQRRVAGVLPVTIDVPHTGTAFHFVRPLVVNEETKVAFTYKSK